MTKKKKKAEKPLREPTKRQLSKWQQQQKRQRIILSVGIFIIAATLVISILGWYIGYYRPLHQTAIRVNDTEFDMGYYIDMLKLHGEGQPPEYMYYLADDMVKEIEQNELIKQGASKLGISASDDEVKETLKSLDLPVNDASRDSVRSQLLITRLFDEYFEYQVPMSVEQVHIKTMLLESESQALEVRDKLANSDNFTELAEELSLDYYSKIEGGDLGWHPENILNELLRTSIPADYAFASEVGVLSQPIYDEEITKGVGYWLIKVMEREEEGEEVHVNAMLLGSEEEAQEARAELEDGGDFATLAKELSQLVGAEENEGELGMITRDKMSPAFDEFVFDPEVELATLSEPIRDEAVATKGGYWLIKALDKDDDRPIEDSDRDLLKGEALDEWIASLWDDPNNDVDDSFLDDAKKEWAIEQVMRG